MKTPANEAQFREFVDANVVGILYGDIHGTIRQANDELLRIVGYSRKELEAGQLFWNHHLPPEYQTLDQQAMAEARERGACTPYEKEYLRKDGSRVPVLLGYSLLGETRQELVAFILDLSQRKQAEQQLRDSEEQLRLGMQVTGFALAKFDYHTHTVQLSPEAAALFGLPTDQLTVSRQQIHATFHPEEQAELAQIIAQVLDPNGPGWFARDHRVVHPNGDVKWLTVRKQVFFERTATAARPDHAILVALDITEHKQAEQEREQLLLREQAARLEAERANRVKDEFLAVLSHELRSPLNPILGWSKLLQTQTFDVNQTREALQTIERNAKLQMQLIDDLLDVAKILRGKLSLEPTPVDLVFVVEAAIETVRTAALGKSIYLHAEIEPVGQVSGDSGRLQQVVWNLLSNAIKFSPNGSQVDVRLWRDGWQAYLSVSDQGKGINSEFLPHIFESFRQEDASTTRKYGGLGLGLAIVRTLVEAHGGTITAESPGEEQGAIFTVCLPLLVGTPTSPKRTQPLSAVNLQGLRVLVVDDEADTRELHQIILSQYGAEVQAVASAAEALTTLEAWQPAVLVSDIGMPGTDGYDLIRAIRAFPNPLISPIPALALSAYAREEDRKRAEAAGFQSHMSKPVDPLELVNMIAQLTHQ